MKTKPKATVDRVNAEPDFSPVLIDRISTPEVINSRHNDDAPLAIFKIGKQHRIVRIVSAFHNKDLLVPVPHEDLSDFETRRIKQEHPGPSNRASKIDVLVTVINIYIIYTR
jgi:hypothetical protein